MINIRADSVTRVGVGQLVAGSRIRDHCGSLLLLLIDHLCRLSAVLHLLGAERGITVCCIVLLYPNDLFGRRVGITRRLVEVVIRALVKLRLLAFSHGAHHSILSSNSLQVLAESLSVLKNHHAYFLLGRYAPQARGRAVCSSEPFQPVCLAG